MFSVRGAYGWSEPQPLPRYLQLGNWQADALISADGSVLLFAANYPAEGEERPSLNIFVSERTERGWGAPYSIGPAINTTGMERSPFLHPDMKTLYFSSDRLGTHGELDVWVTRRLADTCWNCWSEPENLGDSINTDGRDCWYKISTDGKTAYYAQKNGRRHDIYCVAFSSLPELKRIAAFVATYGYKLRLAGHTDNIGNAEDNKQLSQARAESVKRQLIEYGVNPANIQAFGYGDTKPVAPNDTEEGRALNRRVEITIY